MNKTNALIFFFWALTFMTHASACEKNASSFIWSILICTLDERKDSFDCIYENLRQQIVKNHLENEIEVLYFCDNRQYTVGFKRNYLLEKSKGTYTCFVDDDDMVSDNYIQMIYEKLKKSPDCVSLVGIITFDGKNPKSFIHSIKYDHYFEKDGVYYRPPNHLNPIKRSLAIQASFTPKNFGEDTDWAMALAKLKLLKTEEEITEPYYFYNYVSHKK